MHCRLGKMWAIVGLSVISIPVALSGDVDCWLLTVDC